MPTDVLIAAMGLAIVFLAVAVFVGRRVDTRVGVQADADKGPWHRHVSPIFFLFVIAAGLMIGFVGFFVVVSLTQ
jgi:hypothetical protein